MYKRQFLGEGIATGDPLKAIGGAIQATGGAVQVGTSAVRLIRGDGEDEDGGSRTTFVGGGTQVYVPPGTSRAGTRQNFERQAQQAAAAPALHPANQQEPIVVQLVINDRVVQEIVTNINRQQRNSRVVINTTP